MYPTALPACDNARTGRRPNRSLIIPRIGAPMNWYQHQAGRICQRENIQSHASFQYCNVGIGANSCSDGQNCVMLPGRNTAVCVPPGKECVAAGCAAGTSCAVDKSNPAVVHCDKPTAADEPPAPTRAMPVKGAECCSLMQHKSGSVDCFGCAHGICKDPGWYLLSSSNL